tara:strand:- start:3636 stop:4526 length:891 start_codon:yes stop_codon:yes gene_type:complete
MAFKFKVKKRPSLAQAAAGGFAQGVATGINRAAQLSLQDRLKKQEEEKNRLKKELDLFNGMVSDVELTQANRETIMRGKRMIIASDGKTGASTVYSSISPDFEFMPSKEEEKAEDKLVENIEKQAMETAGMIGRQPTKLEEKERTKASEIKLGLKPIHIEEEQEGDFLNTYNKFADGSRKLISSKSKPVKLKEEKPTRIEEMRKGNDQVFYNVFKDGTKQEYKRVYDKYKEDELFDLPEKGGDINTNQMTWSNVQEGVVNIAPGDTISDPQLGNLKFKGGDSSNLENYDFIGFPEQ